MMSKQLAALLEKFNRSHAYHAEVVARVGGMTVGDLQRARWDLDDAALRLALYVARRPKILVSPSPSAANPSKSKE